MASGDPLFKFMARDGVPLSSNPATPDETGGDVPVLDFDDATDESIYFFGVMDENYDGTSAIDITIGWKFTTHGGGTSTCQWKVNIGKIADDADSTETLGFGTEQTALATEASAAGELDYHTDQMTNAQADAVQPGDMFVLRVVRDAASGTASPGDAELHFVVGTIA